MRKGGPARVIRSTNRPNLARPARALAWLVIALSFLRLFIGTSRPTDLDVRGGMALAGALALVMAALTATGQGRAIRLASNGAALGLLAFAGWLVVMHLAHETGLVLIAGCVLVLGWSHSPGTRDAPGPSDGGRR
jgi:hypothetical protein